MEIRLYIQRSLKLRMERLELSKQKLLGPKSSASTNSATPAPYMYVYIILK